MSGRAADGPATPPGAPPAGFARQLDRDLADLLHDFGLRWQIVPLPTGGFQATRRAQEPVRAGTVTEIRAALEREETGDAAIFEAEAGAFHVPGSKSTEPAKSNGRRR